MRDRPNKETLRDGLRIPTLMSQFSEDLQSLSSLIASDQSMVNDVSRQLQEGDSRIPRFAPFVIA